MRPDAGHGSNYPTERASPLICWGAGIHKDQKRKNVRNIDIAPLISALLGINFPSNSRGIIPIDYLDISLEEKYKLLLNNLHQIFYIYERRNGRLSKGTLIYRNHLTMQKIKNRLIEMSITNGTITNETFTKIRDSIQMVLDAIQYDELYFTYNIIFSGLLAVLFWILYLFSIIPGEIPENKKEYFITKKFILLVIFYFSCISSVVYSETFFFAYYAFPIGSFCLLMNNYKKFLSLFYKSYTCPPLVLIAFFLYFYISLILGFYRHQYFSVTFFIMSLLSYILPFTNPKYSGAWNHTWAILCVILSLFSSISFNSTSEIGSLLILTGCVLWHLSSLYYFFEIIINKEGFHVTSGQYLIILVQNLCSFSAVMIRFGTPPIEDCYKFVILIVLIPLVLIPFSMKIAELKIFTIFLGVIPVLIIISLPQDLLVLSVFSMLLINCYSIVKIDGSSYTTQYLQYFIVCLIIIGMNLFCLTGIVNLYNLDYPRWINNSEKYEWVKYDIYILKFFLSIVLTGCILRYIFLKTGMELKTCFIFLEIFFSSMLFHIILRIRNSGSWLQMGTSFINFIIVNFFPLFSILFIQAAHFLMDFGFPFLFGEKLLAFTNSI
ncbi:GPI ethanolamine phosphate transferase 1-like isoform X1 [Harmonia axyridis]|uniref:GPI ethanolamine phosphate transferase 1-like isoform X1 n=1 Tax=Harmonia axyridis TaxID=115357 RepID=UPI001E2791BB|nr:GPI ethanolamine phosphate transferase 1-like isoform X1 [Harmonia axyridis]